MLPAIRLGATTVETVTDESASFTQSRPWTQVMVRANVAVCLKTGSTATEDDFYLKEDTYLAVELTEGETLHYILATGESDGEIRITTIAY